MNTSLPLKKRNLLILLIALFASMHNPAFGMKRQRPSEHTPPPAKRRRRTKADRTDIMSVYICLTCKKTFDTRYEMNQHGIDNARHQNYAILTRETQHNDSENESGLNPPIEGVTRKTLIRLDEQSGYFIQSRQVATTFAAATTEEELLSIVLEFTDQVKNNVSMATAPSSSSRRRGQNRPIIEREDDSDDEEYDDDDYEEEEYEEEKTKQRPKRGTIKELYFEDGFFRCKNCTQKYRRPSALSQHFARYSGHASHTMKKYRKQQATPYDREYLHNGTYSCKRCPFNTTKPVEMRNHMTRNRTHKTHTIANHPYDIYKRGDRYCCFAPDCDKRYSRKEALATHFSRHPNHKQYLS